MLPIFFIHFLLGLSRVWLPISAGADLAYRWDFGDAFLFFVLMGAWSFGLNFLHRGAREFKESYYFLALGIWPPLRFVGLLLYLLQMARFYSRDRFLSIAARAALLLVQTLVFSALLW